MAVRIWQHEIEDDFKGCINSICSVIKRVHARPFQPYWEYFDAFNAWAPSPAVCKASMAPLTISLEYLSKPVIDLSLNVPASTPDLCKQPYCIWLKRGDIFRALVAG